jgi:hypothetical protein
MIPWTPTIHQLCPAFQSDACRATSLEMSCIRVSLSDQDQPRIEEIGDISSIRCQYERRGR